MSLRAACSPDIGPRSLSHRSPDSTTHARTPGTLTAEVRAIAPPNEAPTTATCLAPCRSSNAFAPDTSSTTSSAFAPSGQDDEPVHRVSSSRTCRPCAARYLPYQSQPHNPRLPSSCTITTPRRLGLLGPNSSPNSLVPSPAANVNGTDEMPSPSLPQRSNSFGLAGGASVVGDDEAVLGAPDVDPPGWLLEEHPARASNTATIPTAILRMSNSSMSSRT